MINIKLRRLIQFCCDNRATVHVLRRKERKFFVWEKGPYCFRPWNDDPCGHSCKTLRPCFKTSWGFWNTLNQCETKRMHLILVCYLLHQLSKNETMWFKIRYKEINCFEFYLVLNYLYSTSLFVFNLFIRVFLKRCRFKITQTHNLFSNS